MVRVAKTAVEALGVLALIGIAAAQLGIPTKEFWDRADWLAVLCLAVAFVDTAWAFLYRQRVERSELQRHKRRAGLHAPLSGLIVAVTNHFPDVEAQELGASVWHVKKRSKLTGKPERLERVHRVRLSAVPAASGLQWEKGRGVVGVAWQDQCVKTGSFGDLASSDATAWAGLPTSRTFGLAFDDFQRVKGYETVVAAPILADEKVVGAVSFDIVAKSGSPRVLDTSWIEESVQTTANTVVTLVSR